MLDTGPLVALLNRREQHHDWVRARLGEIHPPLLTCEAVLAEVLTLDRDFRVYRRLGRQIIPTLMPPS